MQHAKRGKPHRPSLPSIHDAPQPLRYRCPNGRILEKIQIKESKSQSKQLSAELMNLKKTWLVAISLIVRTNCLLDMVAQHRERVQQKIEVRKRQHALKVSHLSRLIKHACMHGVELITYMH